MSGSVESRRLAVGDGHELYVETCGNQHGFPCVYLHGGPGSGCQPAHRTLFDPIRHFAVLFDQRGAGRSTPHGDRLANTTADLVADMEQIRDMLGIARWLVVGGSWGATLALAYAQAHPARVAGLVLRAVFLGTRAELDWAFGTSLATFRPELYADFLAVLPNNERGAPLDAYFRRILDPDPAIHGPAARAYAEVEAALATLRPGRNRLDIPALSTSSERLPPTAFMEAHYFSNHCFLGPNALLNGASHIRDIPGVIVQGRYDLLCPPRTAFIVASAWTAARVEVVESAGHMLGEPGVKEAVMAAIDRLTP